MNLNVITNILSFVVGISTALYSYLSTQTVLNWETGLGAITAVLLYFVGKNKGAK